MFIEVPLFQETSHSLKNSWLDLWNSTYNYYKFSENHWKITVKEFNFGKASSFQPETVLKISYLASFSKDFPQDFQVAFNTK